MTDCAESLKQNVLSIVKSLGGELPMVDDCGNEYEDAREIAASSDTEYLSHLIDFEDHGSIPWPDFVDDEESENDGMYEIDGKFYETVYEDVDGNILTGGEEIELREMSSFDYLSDALDIEYIISRDGSYLGASVLVVFGGPNIWIDTRRDVVRGAWWGDSFEASYHDAIGLDDACEELFNCTR